MIHSGSSPCRSPFSFPSPLSSLLYPLCSCQSSDLRVDALSRPAAPLASPGSSSHVVLATCSLIQVHAIVPGEVERERERERIKERERERENQREREGEREREPARRVPHCHGQPRQKFGATFLRHTCELQAQTRPVREAQKDLL